MTEQQLTTKLEKLGYTYVWLTSGVLTEEILLEQERLFDKGEDRNTEHYRYSTCNQYLRSKKILTTSELECLFELLQNDPNTYMAGSVVIDVFNWIELTDEQFSWFIGKVTALGDWTEKTVLRQTFLRKLRKATPTEELIRDCIHNGDQVVQTYLLEQCTLDQKHLEELSIHGKNKQIRTVAKSRSLASQSPDS